MNFFKTLGQIIASFLEISSSLQRKTETWEVKNRM